ncbi:lysophospholipid acyltransferase family protein [Roseovarius aquimarinus]|uniref:Lysophospholipid acyltransferase family protein n=1 Tax=Roseovarius aquimarinus TaxID=1229156 RepID=A0ABW7I3S0_9RHOB
MDTTLPLAASRISYAHSAKTRPGQAFIRLMESTTGRRGLIRRAAGYEQDIAAGRCFFEVMADRYGLSLDVVSGSLDAIPRTGPVIFIANHPYGILDGLMLGWIMARTRGDFRIMAHSAFNIAPHLGAYLLPIRFDASKEAIEQNLVTRRDALALLAKGGAVGVFPGGTVSTAAKPFSRPMDPAWRSFTARMIAKSEARIVPIYFDGHTSRLFQIASHLHYTLRMGLLIQEFRKRVDTPVRVAIGAPIERAALAPLASDGKAMMRYLREQTYALAPGAVRPAEMGFEFEAFHRD